MATTSIRPNESISMSIDKNSLSGDMSISSKSKKKINKSPQFDHTFKIVMIGDSGVGKSCILLRFADDKFNDNFYATIGVDFRFKNINVDNKNVKLQINSFAHIKDWLEDVSKYTDDNPLKMIIGNKCDLSMNRQVNENDIKSMVDSTGIEIIEASAKMSIKINEIMQIMTRKLIERKLKGGNTLDGNTNQGVSLDNQKNNSGNDMGCC